MKLSRRRQDYFPTLVLIAEENCILAENKIFEEASIEKEICDLRSINRQMRERD